MQSQGLVIPVLDGKLVTLRPFTQGDVDAVVDASSDPLIPLITTVPTVPDRRLAAEFIERQHERAAAGTGYSFAMSVGAECVGNARRDVVVYGRVRARTAAGTLSFEA